MQSLNWSNIKFSLIPIQAVLSLNFSSAGKGPFMGWLGKNYVPEVLFPVGWGDLFYANWLLLSLDNNLKRLIPIILPRLQCSLSKMRGP